MALASTRLEAAHKSVLLRVTVKLSDSQVAFSGVNKYDIP